MLLVGALWGCTNPLLRKGSVDTEQNQQTPNASFLMAFMESFINFKVWLPYLFNQLGSLVFYVLLSNSDLSLAVPICNALAMLFSFVTSAFLGETVDKPFQAFMGATLVLVGVTICVSAQEERTKENLGHEL